MVQLTEMDRNVSLSQQLEDAGGPVLLVNKFDVDANEVDQFLDAWADDAKYFKRQPGYISAQLHRGIAGSCVFLNVAVWEFVTRRAYDRQIRRRLDRLAAVLTRQAPWARISGIAASVGVAKPRTA